MKALQSVPLLPRLRLIDGSPIALPEADSDFEPPALPLLLRHPVFLPHMSFIQIKALIQDTEHSALLLHNIIPSPALNIDITCKALDDHQLPGMEPMSMGGPEFDRVSDMLRNLAPEDSRTPSRSRAGRRSCPSHPLQHVPRICHIRSCSRSPSLVPRRTMCFPA